MAAALPVPRCRTGAWWLVTTAAAKLCACTRPADGPGRRGPGGVPRQRSALHLCVAPHRVGPQPSAAARIDRWHVLHRLAPAAPAFARPVGRNHLRCAGGWMGGRVGGGWLRAGRGTAAEDGHRACTMLHGVAPPPPPPPHHHNLTPSLPSPRQSTFIHTHTFSDGQHLLLWMGDRWNAQGPGGVGNATYVSATLPSRRSPAASTCARAALRGEGHPWFGWGRPGQCQWLTSACRRRARRCGCRCCRAPAGRALSWCGPRDGPLHSTRERCGTRRHEACALPASGKAAPQPSANQPSNPPNLDARTASCTYLSSTHPLHVFPCILLSLRCMAAGCLVTRTRGLASAIRGAGLQKGGVQKCAERWMDEGCV